MKIKRITYRILSLFLVAFLSLTLCTSCIKSEDNTIYDDDKLSFNGKFYNEEPLKSGADIFNYLLDVIKISGKTTISSVLSKLVMSELNTALVELGYDTRSIEEKKLDQISSQMTKLQEDIQQGFENVMRKQVQIRNETIMDKLLGEVQEVSGPVLSLVKTLNIISQKELSNEYSETELKAEKERLAQDCSELKFSSLTPNAVWYSCKMLAENIIKPSQANVTVNLWTLYEETYGALETWDYMMIEPRTNFMGYLAFIVNSLAELSKIAAEYKIEQLPENDANIETIKDGIEQMVNAVNNLNEKFQSELLILDGIKEKHDEKNIITHRDRTSDAEGNLIVKDGISLSTRLLPVTTGNSSYNYVCYEENDVYPSGMVFVFNYNYNLSCTNQTNLYSTIIVEYEKYCLSLGYKDGNYSDFTIKDYLATVGFMCRKNEKENFIKAKGFYSSMVETRTGGSGNNEITSFDCNYVDFYKHTNVSKTVSQAKVSGKIMDDLDNWYLCFINVDQTTLLGEITPLYWTSRTDAFKNIWHGANNWDRYKGSVVTLLDSHK